MIEDPVFAAGQVERFKGLMHVGMLALATMMCGYNMAAWLARREGHLRTNALIYFALIWNEAKHVSRHLGKDAGL